MKEYLINSGSFNIVVIPQRKQYFVLSEDAASKAVLEGFLAAGEVDYSPLQPRWFSYGSDESWKRFDGSEGRIDRDVSETELVDYFVLKKFNFGSLVAVRDVQQRKVQLFKRDKLPDAAVA